MLLASTSFLAVAAAAQAQPAAATGPLADAQKLNDQYLAATIPLGGGRVERMAVSPDGRFAWLAANFGHGAHCLDTRAARYVGGFGPLWNPQGIAYCPLHKRLYVVDGSDGRRGDARRASLLTFDANAGKLLAEADLPDWRLCRLSDTVLSADGNSLFVSSQATCTDLHGRVPAAVFGIDAGSGACRQIIGLPLGRLGNPVVDLPRNIPIALDAGGNLLAANVEPQTLSRFTTRSETRPRHLKLTFAPRFIRRAGGRMVAAGDDVLAVIDEKDFEVAKTIEIKGTPTGLCLDRAGWMAFVAISGSSEIRQVDLATGELGPSVDARRPRGAAVADAVRGREVHDITALALADAPRRLIGLGFGGYTPFVVSLDGKERQYLAWRGPAGLAIDANTAQATVSFASGHTVTVDLRTDRMCGSAAEAAELPRSQSAFGPRTRAGIFVEGEDMALKLADGSKVVLPKERLHSVPAAVAVSSDERFAYSVVNAPGGPTLLKFRLTKPGPATAPSGR
jgi:DNA-binding beta-propeller fold protein YncE